MGRFKRRPNDTKRQKTRDEDGFGEWVYTNENFIQFYKAQKIVSEDEWDTYMEYLGTGLPTTFRINTFCPFKNSIHKRIHQFNLDQANIEIDGSSMQEITPIPWYPENQAFQWPVERRVLRNHESLKEFQKWLIELSDSGSITRQEAVSMLPPLFLDIQSNYKVLDMCAAPGSKTSQILEMVDQNRCSEHRGLVMANDVDKKRACMLVHQSKRLPSPSLLITCAQAEKLMLPSFFDRILCDVPCSGDGTLRKNPMIWKSWNPKSGISLHVLQLQIAKRGAHLLKIGGLLCYSTCSFNPVENEAVVASLLEYAGGALELVDVSDKLVGLRRRPGLCTWKVFDSEMQVHSDFQSMENPKGITETMFPPSLDRAKTLHLDRCLRCLPHDQNTGGFFIALFRKILDLTESLASHTNIKSKYNKTPQNDDYRPISEETFQELVSYYKFSPLLEKSQFMTRSNDTKAVTFLSKSLDLALLQQLQELKVKIIFAGVRAFERNRSDSHTVFRLSYAALPSLSYSIAARKMNVTHKDLLTIVSNPEKLFSYSDFSEKAQKELEDSDFGSLIWIYKQTEAVVWRGKSSVAVMAAKSDRIALLSALKEFECE